MDWNIYCPHSVVKLTEFHFRLANWSKIGFNHGQPQALCKGCGRMSKLSYNRLTMVWKSELYHFRDRHTCFGGREIDRATGRLHKLTKTIAVRLAGSSRFALSFSRLVLLESIVRHRMPTGRIVGLVHQRSPPPFGCTHLRPMADACLIAFAPVWRLVLAFVVGTTWWRTLDLFDRSVM